MGYFANGTEGGIFYERYCCNCANSDNREDTPGCVVWDLHLLYNYDHVNDDQHPLRVCLDSLITQEMHPDGYSVQRCAMFRPKGQDTALEMAGQLNALDGAL